MEIQKGLDMLDKIYTIRQYDLEEEKNNERKEVEKRLNHISMKEMEDVIKENVKEEIKQKEVLKKLEQLIENYEIKMAFYMEKRYKQGFKDAVNLLKQCEEK